MESDLRDVKNRQLVKGPYLNFNAGIFAFFTGEYNSTGDPIFEFENSGTRYVEKEDMKFYFALGDPEHYTTLLNEQLPWVRSKLEAKTGQNL